MPNSRVYSSVDELKLLANLLSKYTRLPFSPSSIPGAVMEGALAYVRKGKVLATYDFVDVINQDLKTGWQVKSTKATTPVTWKRAKLPNREALIADSRKSNAGVQKLGDAIINFCNAHAEESIHAYGLSEIGYSRLVIHDSGEVTYFERLLCTRSNPVLFNASDFVWHWSTPKSTVKKEQLQALHGYHKASEKKWWAWHGLGENQLHFTGEYNWWPSASDPHAVTFTFPSDDDRIDLDAFMELLDRLAAPS